MKIWVILQYLLLVFFYRVKGDADECKLAALVNRFTFMLTKELRCVQPVLVFSPLSISSALMILQCASKGKSCQEIDNLLKVSCSNFVNVHNAFHDYFAKSVCMSQDYAFGLSTGIWIESGHKVYSDFETLLNYYYNTTVMCGDFNDEQLLMQSVNYWIYQKSFMRINKLLNEPISSRNKLYVVNFASFSACWDMRFECVTLRQFYKASGSCKLVPTMFINAAFLFYGGQDYKAVLMPYKSREFAMLILLPDKVDGLDKIECSMTYRCFSYILTNLIRKEMELYIPTFKADFSMEMKVPLEHMGVCSLYSMDSLLGGLTSSPDVIVTRFDHKSSIEVREEGGPGSNCTTIGVPKPSYAYYKFVIDHPFMFFVVDFRMEMIIFAGKVMDL